MPEDPDLAPATVRDDTSARQHRPGERSSARLVEMLDPPSDFNFRHFRIRHMAAELLRTARCDGVLPGQQARPILAPLVLRTRPLPRPLRSLLLAGTAVGSVAAYQATRRRR